MIKRILYLLILCIAPHLLHAQRHQQMQISMVRSIISQAESQKNNPTRGMLDQLKGLEFYYWHAPGGLYGAMNSHNLHPQITQLIQTYESKLGPVTHKSEGALEQCSALIKEVEKIPKTTLSLQPLIDEVNKIKETLKQIKV